MFRKPATGHANPRNPLPEPVPGRCRWCSEKLARTTGANRVSYCPQCDQTHDMTTPPQGDVDPPKEGTPA